MALCCVAVCCTVWHCVTLQCVVWHYLAVSYFVLQCVAMCGTMLCCSVLQCVAVCCSVLICTILQSAGGSGEVCVSPATRCVTLCCMVFQCLYSAEGSSEVRVLNCVENVGSPSEACCRVLQGDARCCLVLQGVVVCCSVLQCVAANVAACSPVLLSVCRDWGGGGGKSFCPQFMGGWVKKDHSAQHRTLFVRGAIQSA